MSLLIRVLHILLAIALVVVCYLVVIWVLGLLGISLPANLLTAIFVVIGLIAAIYALTGRFGNLFP